jgi:hypothetical protein
MLPPRRLQMVDAIALGLPPDRVNYDAMPDGAVVVTETVRPLRTRYLVSAPKQFRLRLYQFDFPGWHVTIDGEPAVTELATPEGTIVILVPQGEHVVEVDVRLDAGAHSGLGHQRRRTAGRPGRCLVSASD